MNEQNDFLPIWMSPIIFSLINVLIWYFPDKFIAAMTPGNKLEYKQFKDLLIRFKIKLRKFFPSEIFILITVFSHIFALFSEYIFHIKYENCIIISSFVFLILAIFNLYLFYRAWSMLND